MYRLIRVEPFGDKPTIVRVFRNGDEYRSVAYTFEGDEGAATVPTPTHARKAALQREQWGQLIAVLEKGHFWDSPIQPPPRTDHLFVADGEGVLIEGRRGSWYHAIIRTPVPAEPDDEAKKVFLELSGLNLRY